MALQHTAELAIRLNQPRNGKSLLRDPIIEMVCGTILDTCNCEPRKTKVFISEFRTKLQLLLDSLAEVIRTMQKNWKDNRFVFALELEPGDTYVLQNSETLRLLFDILKAHPERELLQKHVGLNADIAHMKISDVTPDVLASFLPWIVHSHACDHPGMHSRDQEIGRWTSVDCPESPFTDYIRVLSGRASLSSEPGALPFSGAVAIELEGCSHTNWIHNSISALRRACTIACNSEP